MKVSKNTTIAIENAMSALCLRGDSSLITGIIDHIPEPLRHIAPETPLWAIGGSRDPNAAQVTVAIPGPYNIATTAPHRKVQSDNHLYAVSCRLILEPESLILNMTAFMKHTSHPGLRSMWKTTPYGSNPNQVAYLFKSFHIYHVKPTDIGASAAPRRRHEQR